MKNIVSYITLAISLCALIWCAKIHVNQPKVAYLRMDEVFNAFNMKLELEKDFQLRVDVSEKRLESLKLEQLKPSLGIDSLAIVNQSIEKEMALLQSYMQELKPKYDRQIQGQLSSYIQEYVKKTDVQLFFTSLDGSTILHGEEKWDHTKQVINFINEKYEGTH
jgi:hypothetical protein